MEREPMNTEGEELVQGGTESTEEMVSWTGTDNLVRKGTKQEYQQFLDEREQGK